MITYFHMDTLISFLRRDTKIFFLLSCCSVEITYWDNNRRMYLNVQCPIFKQCQISNVQLITRRLDGFFSDYLLNLDWDLLVHSVIDILSGWSGTIYHSADLYNHQNMLKDIDFAGNNPTQSKPKTV
jgi:hypothetical protein